MATCPHCRVFESEDALYVANHAASCPTKIGRLEEENEALRRLFRLQKKAQAEIPCDCCDVGPTKATLEELELAWVEVERIMGDGE